MEYNRFTLGVLGFVITVALGAIVDRVKGMRARDLPTPMEILAIQRAI
jgi:hypothetical protein